MKLNKDGSLTFYISDFYDFDYIDTIGGKIMDTKYSMR